MITHMYKYVIRMAEVPLICASISCKVVRLFSVSQGIAVRPEVEVRAVSYKGNWKYYFTFATLWGRANN